MSEFDDKELFQGALTEEPQAAEPAQPEGQPSPSGNRDPATGRFAAQQTEEPTQEPAAEEPQVQDDPGDRPVPGKRLGEVTRARDAEKARADEAERRYQDMERRFQDMERRFTQPQPQAQQPTVDPIDALLTDPQGFLSQRDTQNMQTIGTVMVDMQPGGQEARQTAFQALEGLKQTNPVAHQSAVTTILSQPPIMQAKAMVDWHKTYQTQQRVGADPDAFFSRTLDERLADPAFAKSLVEKLTGQARQQPQGGGGRPAIDLPPSLNRMAAAGQAADDVGDMSDGAIFANALR